MNILVSLIKFLLLPGLLFWGLGAAQVEAALTLEDCQKCHAHEYQQITLKGMGHKEKVTCLECHKGHRPQTANNIPGCRDCHEKPPHENMIDCASCHKRKENCKACHQVHQPLARTDGGTALLHCKICHPGIPELLRSSTSKHRGLSCAFCHKEHRDIQRCRSCHGLPHPEGTHTMFPKCAECHNIAHDLNRM